MIPFSVGIRLGQLMKSRGMDAEALSERTKIPAERIRGYLNGEMGQEVLDMMDLAAFFNQTMDELVGLSFSPLSTRERKALERAKRRLEEAADNIDEALGAPRRIDRNLMRTYNILSIVEEEST